MTTAADFVHAYMAWRNEQLRGGAEPPPAVVAYVGRRTLVEIIRSRRDQGGDHVIHEQKVGREWGWRCAGVPLLEVFEPDWLHITAAPAGLEL